MNPHRSQGTECIYFLLLLQQQPEVAWGSGGPSQAPRRCLQGTGWWGAGILGRRASGARTPAGANLRPLPLPTERLCGSLCLRLCAGTGWGGQTWKWQIAVWVLKKCLEGWTFSLETLAHLERTSLLCPEAFPPRPPLPSPAHSLSPSLPRRSSGSRCSCISPAACLHLVNCARAQTLSAHCTHPAAPFANHLTQLTDSLHPSCGPLTNHLTQLTDL